MRRLLFLPVVFILFSLSAPAEEKPSGTPEAQTASPYSSGKPVALSGKLDKLLHAGWEKARLSPPDEASDSVMVRRLYLGLTGRLPTIEEARAYVESGEKDKLPRLVDRLLAGEGFVDLWTMRWCDVLRVKSEAPINLWPNAVYVYERRIREFFRSNEPYDRFAKSLLLSSGSNFRVPEANFYRAVSDKSPVGAASAVALFFFGENLDEWPKEKRQRFISFFEGISYKPTLEWKEEIVYMNPSEKSRKLYTPNGTAVIVKAGEDPRKALAGCIFSREEKDFSRATVQKAWFYLLGRPLKPGKELGTEVAQAAILDELAREFKSSGYDFKALCKRIVLSAAYRSSFLHPGDYETAARNFAVYEPRRMEAEVLDDALFDLTGKPRSYVSVIPEPFSYIPPDARTVSLADGSISSSFLVLFGRSPRDAGSLPERDNRITTKQKQYLFNSGEIYSRLGKTIKEGTFKSLKFPEKVEHLYRLFYSRPPTEEENRLIAEMYKKAKGRERGDPFFQDLGWLLLNSREFIYQH